MVAGRKYWIVLWYGILLIGAAGLWASLYWARQTRWRNAEEVLRAAGTILASVGMLLLLHRPGAPAWTATGEILLLDALVCFIAAFLMGRRGERERAACRPEELASSPSSQQPVAMRRMVSPDTSSSTTAPHSS